MNIPPSIAPGMLPMPPTTAAVKPFKPAPKPMKWYTRWNTRPTITPAAPASAEPMKNAMTITRSTSMPIIAAASRSYAVARIAFPTRVYDTKTVSAAINATVVTMTMIRISEMFSAP